MREGISRKFTKISSNKFKIIDEIVKNDTIIKHSIDLGRVNVDDMEITNKDRSDFFNNNILLDFHTNHLKVEDIVYLNIAPISGRAPLRQSLSVDRYAISIMCPVRFWYMKEKMLERPFIIAEEISKSLDQQRLFGIGMTNIDEWKVYRLSDNFSCLELILTVSDMAIKR